MFMHSNPLVWRTEPRVVVILDTCRSNTTEDRHIISSTADQQLVAEEVLATVLTEVGHMLTYVSSTAEDPQTLMPNHIWSGLASRIMNCPSNDARDQNSKLQSTSGDAAPEHAMILSKLQLDKGHLAATGGISGIEGKYC